MRNRQDYFRDFYDPNDGFLNSFDPGFESIDDVDWANFDDCDGNFFALDRLDGDEDGVYEDKDGFDDGWYDNEYDGEYEPLDEPMETADSNENIVNGDAKFIHDNRLLTIEPPNLKSFFMLLHIPKTEFKKA